VEFYLCLPAIGKRGSDVQYLASQWGSVPVNQLRERMYWLRISLGYTQQFIADMVGVSQSEWSLYETGGREPSYPAMIRIQQITGAPPWWIKDGLVTGVPPDLLRRIEQARRRAGRRKRSGRG